ncbi:MOSC domain-containing protein [Urechidicola croceus]|uniref:MOSC domain-containing protein n=1 Tax=Urechidicola croceus TaxID=1850246 RepID=A0A1D8PBE6_9FLAO|nr:MOSC domain-containing protein [Urechidicola croceus]AOW21897.1 MOSC domain-containing protein [Urechidicola croceus]
MKHLTTEQLKSGLSHIQNSPKDDGVVELIVCRPEENQREVLAQGVLDLEVGLVGDNWKTRGSSRTTDGFGHPHMQLNIMNSRAIQLIAQEKNRWKLAGDQLFVDLDLSAENLPIGTKLSIGTAIIQITEIPHLGCKKFVERFGLDAMKFVNSTIGKSLNLRGVNAKVIKQGIITIGDKIRKTLSN